MDNKILDTLSGRELREMIEQGNATLGDLSVQALETLFDYESERVSEDASDPSLLLECAKILDDANQGEEAARKNGAFLKRVLDERCAEEPPKKRKRRRWKKVAIVAAVALLLAFGITAFADTMGYSILEYMGFLREMKPGDKVNLDGITLEQLEVDKKYDTVEEMLHGENLEIMYPTVLPEGVSVKSISIYKRKYGGKSIDYNFGNPNIEIIIDTMKPGQEEYSHLEKHTVGTHDFYLFEEDKYYAVCHENNIYYSFSAASRRDLLLILDNMKEYTP